MWLIWLIKSDFALTVCASGTFQLNRGYIHTTPCPGLQPFVACAIRGLSVCARVCVCDRTMHLCLEQLCVSSHKHVRSRFTPSRPSETKLSFPMTLQPFPKQTFLHWVCWTIVSHSQGQLNTASLGQLNHRGLSLRETHIRTPISTSNAHTHYAHIHNSSNTLIHTNTHTTDHQRPCSRKTPVESFMKRLWTQSHSTMRCQRGVWRTLCVSVCVCVCVRACACVCVRGVPVC
jgi:hypothetical protein